MKSNKWYKLDNAAKIFPPTTTYYDPKIFRFSVLLTEEVNPDDLTQALNETLKEFPIFKSILKKGIFWYYLEETNEKPIVHLEDRPPCTAFKSNMLFEVTYFKKKINLEVYHALSDGAGCITFFRNLIYNYLKINKKIKNTQVITTSSSFEKASDSFEKYYDPCKKIVINNREKAYTLKGSWYPEGKLNITTGVTSTNTLLNLAKSYHTTITVLLLSFVIKSLENIMTVKDKKKPISITVPIDLRKFYKSETVRNFFNVTNIYYQFKSDNDSLEDIIKTVHYQMKKSLEKEAIENQMTKMLWLENLFFIRLIPLFIKNIILKYTYKGTRTKQTLGLSNVGIIDMPEDARKYIDKFMVMNSTDSLELVVVSYLDNISLTFSSHFTNNELEKSFFCILKEYGLNLEIYSNELKGGYNE